MRWQLGMLIVAIAACGCGPSGDTQVTVYAALDSDFSQPVLDDFTKQTNHAVRAKFDTEATKTVGLAAGILAERNHARCDLFWNNEFLHTLRLDRAGLLEPFTPPNIDQFPAAYRSPNNTWYGFAARARVLLVNTQLVPEQKRPRGLADLADPQWKNQTAMALPLFGTTATHAACLFAAWGDDRAQTFFQQVRQNAQIMSGNKRVAEAVGSGRLAFGLTDTDDAAIEIRQGAPVVIIFPDQATDGSGTLLIPNTVALIRNSPQPQVARELAAFVLRAETETALAHGPSAQIPVLKDATASPKEFSTAGVRWMTVDFAAAADEWETASQWLRTEFAQ